MASVDDDPFRVDGADRLLAGLSIVVDALSAPEMRLWARCPNRKCGCCAPSGPEQADADAEGVGDAGQVVGIAGDDGGLVADGGGDDDGVDDIGGPRRTTRHARRSTRVLVVDDDIRTPSTGTPSVTPRASHPERHTLGVKYAHGAFEE